MAGIKRHLWHLCFMGVVMLLGACDNNGASVEALPPTATLAPIVSMTPRFTATPIPSRTPLPTATFTASVTVIPPTASDTPTATVTPPILGSVNSLQSINVRSGPGVNFGTIEVLRPASRVEILGQNTDGEWLNIRMETGDEGWVSSTLIRLQPTATLFPSLTPSPNLTLLAQGTPLPTALFGGGSVTPTPPRSISVATPTAVDANASVIAPEGTALNAATAIGLLQLPNIEAINQTATALAGGGIAAPRTVEPGLGGPTGGPILAFTSTPLPVGTVSTQQGVDVLAYCDDRTFGAPAPTDLAAGSTIEIFWAWFASTRQQVQDHLDAAIYEVRLDGQLLPWRQYTGSIREQNGQFATFWYVPSPPLTRGDHQITYAVTWSQAIFDGTKQFGPGTGTPTETGTCRFTVR